MTAYERELHLNVNILDAGKHPGAWRFQDDPRWFLDIDYFSTIARLAERGTFDAVFLSDGVALLSEPAEKPWQALEPTVLLAALARETEHVGLIGTASTTFNDPFNLARRFASLDHLSRGRAALNVVTSYSPRAAANFGLDVVPDHDARYARAEEFVDVLTGLWDSWDDDAITGKRDAVAFMDPAGVRPIHHRGEHFAVRGPLNVPRSPQGRPVLVQAGSSEVGKRFAARVAEVVFTAQTTHGAAQAFYADMKNRARAFGRDPGHLVVLPGLFPVVGSTEAEAWARKDALDELFPFDLELPRLAAQLGLDPADLPLDRELPYDLLGDAGQFTGSRGFLEATVNLARERGYTVRELLLSNGGGHRQVVGSPEQVVDSIEHWFHSRAADGFNLNFDVFPSGLETFVEHVIPELRRRGLFRSAYTGRTLRDHLGLPRPPRR
ncbi:Nitrilotriacetate monooxygenase component A [Frankia canadensis]|uniref:Nitrilotriacetate monooxygenase component A n=1 Tax=Frankia canadensis TaxID=1836972 RepID=A0A2I2KVZ7_9ACTN|nr:LLM class flavin-dependent oxidoreductase [Frankia canadensis]SNQ49832.1 Nitrilotriacetate monooxygenase component A [Frankia canadensis]SOU57122.1 Nitrilotriacetate monooxygenase component A [Frankia canadensis]